MKRVGPAKNNAELIVGKLSKHKKGFGFVTPEDAEEGTRDIFIPRDFMGSAMDGDTVEVLLSQTEYFRKRNEGMIVKVTERAIKEVVGTFHKNKRYGFVVSDDKRIKEDVFISKKYFSGAQNGDKVVATIVSYPDTESNAEGKITEIIARNGEAGADIKALIRAKGLFFTFPSKAMAQTRAICKSFDEEIERLSIKSELKEKADTNENVDLTGLIKNNHRVDLSDKVIVTIDGSDSKDFDDAISVEKLENGNYLLGVHIADVTHYVTEGSALDAEALKRGTSVYLLDYVVPMLPKELSNGICSLNPGVRRLTISIDMEINGSGEVVAHKIYESIIISKARLIYDDVSDLLENKSEKGDDYIILLKEKYAEIYDNILLMGELAGILQVKREKEGSLDFDFDEAYIKLDDRGIAYSVDLFQRRIGNRLIEEFMLMANKTVAEHFYWMEAPFIYRVHEKPSHEKIDELKEFLRGLGISLKGSSDNIHPKTLADILISIKGSSYENIVSTVILRSMKKAFYTPECQGHFGLSFKYYCHFTSPIRRYPDLLIHRIIKEYINGQPNEKLIGYWTKRVTEAAELSSINERKAMELEREVEKLKKCEYISQYVGEVYDGVISGISNYGIYVQLPNTIEGMIRLEYMMDDYYEAYPDKYMVIGEMTNKRYVLGQKVTVKVSHVDLDNREIDFSLVRPRKKSR